MAKREALIPQSDATRLFKAARAAGYSRARLIRHPDGRIEVVGEDSLDIAAAAEMSPFEKWKAENAR
ncbi:transcription factor iiib subunit [Aquamicrobium sp. NLF2-7]|uniref:transcription factor iiib subunit n=1 Tax=Aquamicrobium sp. NLF2-7 TaxID=2918753 RepID=UPI001EFA4F63|nr:transcription factor iiib subunit [Aquamicrobium sp. NLF2-7]MCG8272554.1 transcription factor iiib subunit [Aquamicrobium sp. NLF2-7]